MASVDTKELKACLMPFADEIRAKLALPHLAPVAEGALVHAQIFLHHLFVYLNNVEKGEEEAMNKLKSSLSVEVIKVSDIAPFTKGSIWRDRVLEELKNLRPGEAALMDSREIKYTHLATLIANMKKARILDNSVKVFKRGEKTYLAKVS